MKRSGLSRAFVAIAMMLIGWLPSLAHDFEVDGVFYNKTSDNTVAVTYKGYSYDSYSNEYIGDVVIPSSVDYNGATYSVTSIGYRAFEWCSSLTSIEIPNSVTSIGDEAFSDCESLTSIEIPNSVTSIGKSAFYSCTNLTDVLIGNSVTSIGDWVFSYCKSLTNIGIPNSVTSIGNYSFLSCSSLTSIEIPNSVTSIGKSAFYSCTNLTDVVIGNSVTSIGSQAFGNCYNLTSIVIPNSVTGIGYEAFYCCNNLTSIEIPNSVTSIGQSAFKGCSSLTRIVVDTNNNIYDSRNGCNAIIETATNALITGCQNTIIPKSVTSIKQRAFEDCSGLISIEIPNSVTWIGDYAFSDCTSLNSIEIPNSVTSIGDRAFSNCTALTSVVWNAVKCSDFKVSHSPFDGCSNITSILFRDNVEHIPANLCYGLLSLTGFEIPNSVTSIGHCAFYGCNSLMSIIVEAGNPKYDSREGCNAILETASNTLVLGCKNSKIPNSVISIGNSAFESCIELTSIEIPNSVTSIGDYAFSGCYGLTSVVIGNSVTNIGDKAFEWCSSLTSIEIPNSVTSIGDFAFWWCAFTKITCLTTTPPTIYHTTFQGYHAIDLYVPAGCKFAYQSANDWKEFRNIIELPPILSNSITLDKYNADMKVGETITLNATILPENVTNKTVEWTSSDETIVVVDENGMVTAIEVGEATITATTTDGTNLSASCKVIVQPTLATSITLNETEIKLEATETATLVAIVLPELTTDKSVAWSSLDETVAVVDENGMVTAISVGETTITVTTVDGTNLSASCKVNVIQLAESITLDKTEISLGATETATLVATVLPELTTDKSVKWSSSDEMVAIVDEKGVVTAISLGEVTITATTTDGSNLSATCQVTVVPTLAVYIELDQTEASIEEKSELQLTATILPEHATNKEVAWSSSDKWVATVDNTGLVTIYAAGEVIITATTTDGTNLSSTCHINVYSGIDGVNGDDAIVATIGDNIVVKNAPLDSVVNVYASNGALVATEVVTDGDVVVETPIKGIYIVSVNGKNFKVVVK